MQIGMTDAGGLHGDHDLIAGRFGIEHIGVAKRVAELDDLIALICISCLRAPRCVGLIGEIP
jgi:hypothetical protein